MVAKSTHPWGGLAVLAIGVALIVIDGTIVGVALPTIINSLGLSLTTAEWVNALYSVVFAALLLSFGKAGDLFGTARLFRLGVLAFVLGSLLAALSSTPAPLIAARAIQGIGAAAVLPSSLSTMNQMFTGKNRAAAFGVWGATMAGAAAIGPLAGGWLTTNWSWPLIFWVNVPIGLIVVAVSYAVLPAPIRAQNQKLDFVSLALSALAAGAGVFAIIEGENFGWLVSQKDLSLGGWQLTQPGGWSIIPAVGAVAVLSLAAFVWRQLITTDPLLDLALFKIPAFSWGNVAALVISAGEYILVFTLPLYLIGVRGLSPMNAGVVLVAMAAGAFLSGAAARHLSMLLSPAGVVVAGVTLELVGVLATSLCVASSTSLWLLALALAVYGAGLGFASAQLTSTILADVAAEKSGQGSATQSTMRQIGAAVGTATAGTLIAVLLPGKILSALGSVGVSGAGANAMSDAITQSAGAALADFARRAAAGQLGSNGEQIVQALRDAFSSSVVNIMWAAGVCLLIGLAAAIKVKLVANRTPAK